MRNAEARIQAAVVAFVRQVAPDVLIFAVPNGGLRTRREAALLKWTGVLAGVPDLVLVGRGRIKAGAFIPPHIAFWEIKTPTGHLSPTQADMLDRLDDMGVPYAIIRSVDDAREALDRLGISTKEARAA